MANFGTIVVFHPAGLSDTMLATPMAVALKQQFPGARLTWMSPSYLGELLLSFSPHIDDVVELDDITTRSQALAAIRRLSPDLLVNLSSFRFKPSFLESMFSAREMMTVLDFGPGKRAMLARMHAVDAYLSVLAPLQPELPKNPFPTIFPEALKESVVNPFFAEHFRADSPVVGIVPGVGADDTKKAWITDGWQYLASYLCRHMSMTPVLIGGESDSHICDELARQLGSQCLNLCGRYSLVETAALLKALALVVGGDCGIIHLAVAVDTPVVGLFGATSSMLRGPLGYKRFVIDQSKRCKCATLENCEGRLPGPGNCMRAIMLDEVLRKVQRVLGSDQPPPEEARSSQNWFWSEHSQDKGK